MCATQAVPTACPFKGRLAVAAAAVTSRSHMRHLLMSSTTVTFTVVRPRPSSCPSAPYLTAKNMTALYARTSERTTERDGVFSSTPLFLTTAVRKRRQARKAPSFPSYTAAALSVIPVLR